MLLLARIALAGWWQGPLLVALFFQQGLLQWIGLAILALITLRQGAQTGTVALLVTFVFTKLAMMAGYYTVLPVLGLQALLVVVAAALLLRHTMRLEWSIILAALLVVLGGAVLGKLAPETFALYKSAFSLAYTEFVEARAQTMHGHEAEVFRQMFELTPEKAYGLATMLLAITEMILVSTALLIGRWWQAALFNPGGFGRELRGYRIEPQLVLVLVLLWVVSQWLGAVVAGSSQVLWFPLVLGGIGLFHWFAHHRHLSTPWYVLFYLLVFLMYVVVFMALVIAAMLDSFFGIRQRLATTGK